MRGDVELLALGFVIGSVKSLLPLGPTGVLVVERALEGRGREALAAGGGGVIVESVYCLAALMGARALVGRHPYAFEAAQIIGAVLIAAIGLLLALRPHYVVAAAGPVAKGGAAHFFVGLSTAALNPAMLVTWSVTVGILASQGLPINRPVGLLFPVVLGVGTLTANLVLVLVLGRLGRRLSPRSMDRIMRGVGFTLMAIGAWRGVAARP